MKKLIVSCVVCIVIIPALFYYFIMPRVELGIETTLQMPPLGPLMAVGLKLKNQGTTELKQICLKINVYDQTINKEMASYQYNITQLKPWYAEKEYKYDFSINGTFSIDDTTATQYDTFSITLQIEFKTLGGGELSQVFTHTYVGGEDAPARISYNDKIFAWGS